jgi:thymidylate kinase
MIVCVEGNDFSGKSTQVELLKNNWQINGAKAVVAKSPSNAGFGLTHKLIYIMLNSGAAKKYPCIFQGIFVLNRILWSVFVKPFTDASLLILDRWSLSMMIYGGQEGVPNWLLKLFSRACLKPDLTIILDANYANVKRTKDAYELDDELQKKVKQDYKKFANGSDVVIVNAQGTKEEVAERVMVHVLGCSYTRMFQKG